jgi:hypothetical protein
VSNEEEENEIKKHKNNENKMQSIYEYSRKVLDALNVKWGPTHLGKTVKLENRKS